MDNLWLLVPVKPFDEAKSRLATVLPEAERAALSRYLLTRTITLASDTGLFARVLVVSRDCAALDLAKILGALPLLEEEADLNLALMQATRHAETALADAILVLPADLPLLTARDLTDLCTAGREGDVVLAPSRDGGTNALLIHLPAPFAFAFGENSFSAHRHRAVAAGREVKILHSETLALDLDWPDDLALLSLCQQEPS